MTLQSARALDAVFITSQEVKPALDTGMYPLFQEHISNLMEYIRVLTYELEETNNNRLDLQDGMNRIEEALLDMQTALRYAGDYIYDVKNAVTKFNVIDWEDVEAIQGAVDDIDTAARYVDDYIENAAGDLNRAFKYV